MLQIIVCNEGKIEKVIARSSRTNFKNPSEISPKVYKYIAKKEEKKLKKIISLNEVYSSRFSIKIFKKDNKILGNMVENRFK